MMGVMIDEQFGIKETFVTGQVFVFSGITLVTNSTSHLGQVE